MRPLFVERGPDPPDTAMLAPMSPDALPLAAVFRGNFLRDEIPAPECWPAGRLVTWSGSLAATLLDPHPPTWLKSGHEALDGRCRDLRPALRMHDARICLHPHCRHVLNDLHSCLGFLHRHEGQPFEIALAPASLLEAGMLDAVEDHLERLIEGLGPRSAMTILHDVRPSGTDEPLRAVPLGQGCLPREQTLALLRDHVSPDQPLVLMDDDLPAQLRWLGVG